MMVPPQNHITMPCRTPDVSFQRFNPSWNSNQGVANILYAAPHHPEWLSRSLPELASSGSQFIVEKCDGNWFKNDAFDWKRRKEGKLIREDHMKLKINKEDRINAHYVHSAIVPTFHRRVYHLIENSEFVLIHYLYVPEHGSANCSNMAEKIAKHMRSCNLKIDSYTRLFNQLSVILGSTHNQQAITSIAEDVFQRLNTNPEYYDQLPSTSHESHLERRNSCSSAFRKGLSSMALRRQPSTFSDSVDAHFVGAIMTNCEPERPSQLYAAEDVRSYSGETQRSSNPDEDSSVMNPASLRSASAGATSQASVPLQQTSDGPEIIDVAPSTANIKGGTKILIVGDWYMRGHGYSILFGDRKVPARLIRPGVLSCVVPPARSAGPIPLSVLCNDAPASQARHFVYEDVEKEENLQLLIDRLQLIVTAFGLSDSLKNFNGNALDMDATVATVLQSLGGLPLMHPSIVSPPSILPSRTILHLAAQLDFHSVISQVLLLWRSLPTAREFNPLARDAEGSTPLHYAARNANLNAARSLLENCPQAGDVLDDRNRTAADVAVGDQILSLVGSCSTSHEMSPAFDQGDRKQHVTSTALWVMTNGETVTDSHRLRERHLIDEESTSTMSAFQDGDEVMHSSRSIPSDAPHLEISMDTDVDLPDSPKMADLFKAATSREELTENNREKMASLAKQIIDALPDRIKNDSNSFLDDFAMAEPGSNYMNNLSQMLANPYWSPGNQPYGIPMEQEVSPVVSGRASSSSFESHLRMGGTNSFTSSQSNNHFDGNNIDFDKDLGEFFNLSLEGDVDPVQQRLGNLKLNHNEQRELYEAAMVIQRAYREYRERSTFRRQEAERNAAVTIQSCYRRYKQYCYIKQLHSAAIVVQKHFRLKRVNQKEANSSNEVQEHPTLEGQILRIQVPQTSSSLSREHRAATTIQTAYRGHRKRQAAARKIQKFMKESRQKLRRMAEQSGDGSCSATQLPMAAAGNPFQDLDSLRIITEKN